MPKLPSVRRVVVFIDDDLELLDLAGPTDVFDAANRLGASPSYSLVVVSPTDDPSGVRRGSVSTSIVPLSVSSLRSTP